MCAIRKNRSPCVARAGRFSLQITAAQLVRLHSESKPVYHPPVGLSCRFNVPLISVANASIT